MQETELIIVSQEEAGERLDKFLSSKFVGTHSRTYFQMLIDEGLVLVNGERIKKREKVKEGDEVEVEFIVTPELSLERENIPLTILYEDEFVIVVNKPRGMVVHPAPGNPNHTFVNALLYHCGTIEGGDSLRPGVVHRLDKETSGVLIAAKTALAHQRLVTTFAERKAKKRYIGICVGAPNDGLVESCLGRDVKNRQKMAVVAGGKVAKTIVTKLISKPPLSLVELDLITGRTHQIRVHLSAMHCPILGDPLYGSNSLNKKYDIQVQLLHAFYLALPHPMTGELLECTAPLPSDMRVFVDEYFQYPLL